MRLSIITVCICILSQILDCQGGPSINRLNFFDIDLLRATAEGKKGNVMVSPASIKSTLVMILEGAKGLTAKEIKTALRVSPDRDDYRQEMRVYGQVFESNDTVASVQNANALFVSNKLKLKKLYETVVQRLYSAEVNKLNFNDLKASVGAINDWVDKKTYGLIPTIVNEDQISPSTEMMISNALYFKAPWKHSFKTRATYKDCFYNNGVCRNVSMMILQAELNYAYVASLRAHALELPYLDDRYSMILIVPQDQNAGITQLRDLPYVGLPHISDLMEYTDVALTMPKFELEYNGDMVEPLKKMQIETLFSQTANLSGIFELGEYAHLSNIYHTVHIKVDEVGTIAVAASSSAVVPLINNQMHVQINRPFLFFIRDNKYDVVLFEGKIEEPTEFVETKDPPQVPQQVTKQPLASYNTQHQESGQANSNVLYPAPGNQTSYDQNALNQFNFHWGGLNQQVVPSNQQNITTIPQGLIHPNLSSSSTGQQQVYQQGSPNQTSFNPYIQNSTKVNKVGPILTNITSSQAGSKPGGLNQKVGDGLLSKPGLSSLPSITDLRNTNERQPL